MKSLKTIIIGLIILSMSMVAYADVFVGNNIDIPGYFNGLINRSNVVGQIAIDQEQDNTTATVNANLDNWNDTIDNIFMIVENNTDLGYPSGTQERLYNTVYYANTSPISIMIKAHAVGVNKDMDYNLTVNGSIVQDEDHRTAVGAGIHEHSSIYAIIPKFSSYSVQNSSDIIQMEWREYPILAGKNGTLSINQTIINENFTNTFDDIYVNSILKNDTSSNNSVYLGTNFIVGNNFEIRSISGGTLISFVEYGALTGQPKILLQSNGQDITHDENGTVIDKIFSGQDGVSISDYSIACIERSKGELFASLNIFSNNFCNALNFPNNSVIQIQTYINTTVPNNASINRTANLSNIYAPNLTGLVPTASLGSGTPDGTKFLRDDRTWQVPPGGSSGVPFTRFNGTSVNRSTTSTTAYVNAFSLPVSAGKNVTIDCNIIANASVSTVGIWTWSNFTNASSAYQYVEYWTGATTYIDAVGASTLNLVPTTSQGVLPKRWTWTASSTQSTNGYWNISFRAEAAGTVSFMRGSYCRSIET